MTFLKNAACGLLIAAACVATAPSVASAKERVRITIVNNLGFPIAIEVFSRPVQQVPNRGRRVFRVAKGECSEYKVYHATSRAVLFTGRGCATQDRTITIP